MPIICGHVGQMLMGWVDTLMIGRVGVTPLAASAFSNTLLMVPFVFCFGILSAVSVRGSLAYGSGSKANLKLAMQVGIICGAALGLLTGAAVTFLSGSLQLFGQPAEVVSATPGYLVLCAWSAVPALISTASKSTCEALSRPWGPFWVVLGSVGLNVILNWVLIFGNLGMPELGLEGAGLATLIARTVAAVLILVITVKVHRQVASSLGDTSQHPEAPPNSHRKELITQIRLGGPVGAMHLAEISGFSFGSLMMGWISVDALAAHQIALTCAATTFMVPLGLSQAVCVRIGQARGAQAIERAPRVALAGLALAASLMACFGIGFWFGGAALASLFTSNTALVAVATGLLHIAGVFQVFDGIQIVASGALRGYEDVVFPMWFGALSYWGLALPIGSALAFGLGMGGAGIWIGFCFGLGSAAIGLSLRLRHRIRLTKQNQATAS